MNLDEDPDERTRGWRWIAASSYIVIMAAMMIPRQADLLDGPIMG